MSTVTRLQVLLAVVGVLLIGSVASAQTWDLETDFSNSQAGPWNYQRLQGGVYTNLADYVNHDDWATGLNGWVYPPTGGFPCIMQNQSGSTVTFSWGSQPIPPGGLAIHPGPAPGWPAAAVRWTAPAGGLYEVYGKFRWLNWASVRVSILHLPGGGGSPTVLFDVAYADGGWPDVESTTLVSLAQNDSIAYIVDSNGTWGGDFTGMEATITLIPEPSALLALGGGLTGLAGLALRRRK